MELYCCAYPGFLDPLATEFLVTGHPSGSAADGLSGSASRPVKRPRSSTSNAHIMPVFLPSSLQVQDALQKAPGEAR